MCKGDMARMRLIASTSWLKLARSQSFVDVIKVEWHQSMSYILCDPCPQVRGYFLTKLSRGLFRLQLPLEYMAIFAHAAEVPDPTFRQRARQSLVANIARRREYLEQHPTVNTLPSMFVNAIVHIYKLNDDFIYLDDSDRTEYSATHVFTTLLLKISADGLFLVIFNSVTNREYLAK
ncbi:unnamed protein product [Protopolystoma xenopodis]|uniref:Uncharacterized protein n=1 Tax=Protopolystoma xenopodis TaxID=117903 RepID=A0A3S5FH03_9PLAT|nr:unnamed protein product [Protopolystoma xenopodis]